MATVKSTAAAKKRIWRITPEAPEGKFVDVGVLTSATVKSPEQRDREGWAMSSFDLMYGLDVTEIEGEETVPRALADEVFKNFGL